MKDAEQQLQEWSRQRGQVSVSQGFADELLVRWRSAGDASSPGERTCGSNRMRGPNRMRPLLRLLVEGTLAVVGALVCVLRVAEWLMSVVIQG